MFGYSINHMHPLRPLYTSLGSRGPNQIAEHHYRCGLSHEESHHCTEVVRFSGVCTTISPSQRQH